MDIEKRLLKSLTEIDKNVCRFSTFTKELELSAIYSKKLAVVKTDSPSLAEFSYINRRFCEYF
jgi:hypothetical protein